MHSINTVNTEPHASHGSANYNLLTGAEVFSWQPSSRFGRSLSAA